MGKIVNIPNIRRYFNLYTQFSARMFSTYWEHKLPIGSFDLRFFNTWCNSWSLQQRRTFGEWALRKLAENLLFSKNCVQRHFWLNGFMSIQTSLLLLTHLYTCWHIRAFIRNIPAEVLERVCQNFSKKKNYLRRSHGQR